ncbi:shTK domain protein, partial [Cooperia oncophora]
LAFQLIRVVIPDATTVTTVAGATVTTVSSATATVSSSASTASTSCVDKLNPSTGVSDCPARASLCNDATYYSVMTEQCPLTCGRCSGSSTNTTTTNSTTCVDLTNPSTGVSDCPQRVALCTDSNYITLMRRQCPRTCGFCTSASTASGTAATSLTSSATSSSTSK